MNNVTTNQNGRVVTTFKNGKRFISYQPSKTWKMMHNATPVQPTVVYKQSKERENAKVFLAAQTEGHIINSYDDYVYAKSCNTDKFKRAGNKILDAIFKRSV